MKKAIPITCLFLDIGGVLLTDGWGHHARRRAAKRFKLDWAGMEQRHGLNFETHEEDKVTFREYLDRVVFYEKRPFTRAEFRRFMFAQSKPFPDMIELLRRLKAEYGLKIFVVSNESRELNAYRISTFKLAGFVDAFISSCFVGLRKPDADIFKLALDIARRQRGKLSISKIPKCLSRSRKEWESAASCTRITIPRARNWLRSACRCPRFPPDLQILSSWNLKRLRPNCSKKWTPIGVPPIICRSARFISLPIRC
jgi:putative hydrolase of the HAD superfamily